MRNRNDAQDVVFLLMLIISLIVAAALFGPTAHGDALYTVTVSDYCNVRELPSKDSADLGDLDGGEVVTGHDYCDGWVQVDVAFELTQGWVRADLLTLSDYPTGRCANSTGGRVNIRQEPGGDHADWLKAGHSVNAIRWVEVDGAVWAVTKRGYIDGKYLEEEGK